MCLFNALNNLLAQSPVRGLFLHCLAVPGLVLGMPASVIAAPDLNDFNLVFSDEFNGAQLDATKWNTGFLWGPYLPINNEEQLYVDELGINAGSMLGNGGLTPSPFEMTSSSLKIKATPVTNQNQLPPRPPEGAAIWNEYPEYRYNGDDPTDPNDSFYDPANVNYLSGIITSYDAFRFTHGYAEARVKLPEGQGLWPAFWLLNSFYVEDVPEIDIMEFLGHDTETVYHTYHYFEPQNGWNQVSTPSFTSSQTDFTDDWHTFGVTWDPSAIIWYVDGVEARRITSDEYTIPNQAMYVLANLATGGYWPGSPDSTTPFPAEYELDYIRVYQKDIPNTITQTVLDNQYQLMFEDNFNGNSLDTSKWNTHHLWGPYWQINNEKQFYPDVSDTHANESYNSPPISVSNGTLKITADQIDASDLPTIPSITSSAFQEHPEWRNSQAYNNPNFTNPSNDPTQAATPFLPEYTSGIVTTYDSFKFTHGYAEIRAKLPQGDGLWPAFWLLNGYYVDQQPEIDVIETRGENPNELVHSYHLSPKDGGPPSYTWSTFSNDPDGFSDDFHTYGIAWEPGKLDWYVDGVKRHTHTGPSVSTQNMYAILNLAVGGNFVTDQIDDEKIPAEMVVDYVKIYQNNLTVEPTLGPRIDSPVPGDVLTDSTETFSWLNDTSDATVWWLYVGASEGGRQFHDSGAMTANQLSKQVATLPTDGSDVHVRLWYREPGGVWRFIDYVYIAATIEASSPTIVLPEPNVTLENSSETFTWVANNEPITTWWLYVGSSVGGTQYHNSGALSQNIDSELVNNLPSDGSEVHVRLWFRPPASAWEFVDYAYDTVAFNLIDVFPSDGEQLSSDEQNVSWSTSASDINEWWLYAGSTVGGRQYFDSGSVGDASSVNVVGLPTDGTDIHIRLWYRMNGNSWSFEDFTYSATSE